MAKLSIALLGTGTMGGGMAANLLKAGFPLTVYNRTRAKAEPFAAQGAHVADTPAAAAKGAHLILSMLSDDNACRDAWTGADGAPFRIGMAQGNEFSDHLFEKRNYLNLAGSKLRNCSLGPELVMDADFTEVSGHVRLTRGASTLWQKAIASGENNMAHSLANLEHHHFKFAGHRQPGSVHVHFYGADALSFGEGVVLEDGDIAEVRFQGFGRALRNPIHRETAPDQLIRVKSLA